MFSLTLPIQNNDHLNAINMCRDEAIRNCEQGKMYQLTCGYDFTGLISKWYCDYEIIEGKEEIEIDYNDCEIKNLRVLIERKVVE
jgi:hypothetical protein